MCVKSRPLDSRPPAWRFWRTCGGPADPFGSLVLQTRCRCIPLQRVTQAVLARPHEGFTRNLGRHRQTGPRFRAVDRSLTMQLLLDTHIWMWALRSLESLGHAARSALTRCGWKPGVSPATGGAGLNVAVTKRPALRY